MKAKGVVTIVGTTAFEAALLGKKSILFGDVPFALIDGITRVRSFEDLPQLIREFGDIDNKHSCAAYLQTVKDIGFELNVFYLMGQAEKILAGKEQRDERFHQELETLRNFYNCGYETWMKEHKRESM